jgi:hypothetical protein
MKARCSWQLDSSYLSSVIERYRIVSGTFPFGASANVPSTSTVLPAIESKFVVGEVSGIRFIKSFEPETSNCGWPFAATIFPATLRLDGFIVNPFLVMASCNCLKVAALPGFIFTLASPFSKLTSTTSTPETDFNDTRTACAQTSQSMPNIFISIDLTSALADVANNARAPRTTLNFFMVSSPY